MSSVLGNGVHIIDKKSAGAESTGNLFKNKRKDWQDQIRGELSKTAVLPSGFLLNIDSALRVLQQRCHKLHDISR